MEIPVDKINYTAMYMMWVLNQAGYEARVCGGAVRDIILGVEPKDWDIATTALPEQVTAAMYDQGIEVIPTGLQHGTVTAVKDGQPYEITTLRVDEQTDGRHADVRFTDNWELDSNRRDFTFNALYLDENGIVYDYHDGLTDLENGNVRFVNDAETRIQEDYLRILRYYRFWTRMANTLGKETPVDSNIVEAIKNNVHGLKQISGERIWDELKKIFKEQDDDKSVQYTYLTFTSMLQMDVLGTIGMSGISHYNLSYLFSDTKFTSSVAVAMMNTFETPNSFKEWYNLLKNRFHASSNELRSVKFVMDHNDMIRSKNNTLELMAFHDKSLVLDWLMVGSVMNRSSQQTRDNVSLVNNTDVPDFPVSGNDLIELGFRQGPAIGQMLHKLKKTWAHSGFKNNRDQIINTVVH